MHKNYFISVLKVKNVTYKNNFFVKRTFFAFIYFVAIVTDYFYVIKITNKTFKIIFKTILGKIKL